MVCATTVQRWHQPTSRFVQFLNHTSCFHAPCSKLLTLLEITEELAVDFGSVSVHVAHQKCIAAPGRSLRRLPENEDEMSQMWKAAKLHTKM